ncbi:hypothetical protein CBR_g49178 [Chara braunii]|uniref:Uncharacterized protein n=1 Tax=Chara braunii TaxID=69332 RepID=A0A388M478_CHABU|nr:hypothetical protein CBR_g49178 [Chara braunii]|eukprot:GBG89387.1 hypothetical protein CBR_g49178 [Chara braunii]
MTTHGEPHSARGPAPHGEEPRRTTSTPVMGKSGGGVGGEEQRGTLNLWCDYSKRVRYMDWACQDASEPLKPRCGPIVYVANCGDMIRLAGSVLEWADVGDDIFKFTLRKLYRSDGSIDELAKGCKFAGRLFGGYGAGAMALPCFVPLSLGHDEAVHVQDFLEVWASSPHFGHGMDVDPGTSISRRRLIDKSRALPCLPTRRPAVGMSDDSGDERARAPLKLGLQGSRRQGLLGESPIRVSLGGGLGERLEKASGSRSPKRLVARVGAFINSREVAELTAIYRPGASRVREVRGAANTTRSVRPAPAHLQTEASQRGEAGGNVAGEEEVLELGATRESSPVTSRSGGKRNLPLDEGRKGLSALKRQRKQGGSARTPMTEE